MSQHPKTALTTAGIDVGSSAVKVFVMRHAASGRSEVASKRAERIRRRNSTDVDHGCEARGLSVEPLKSRRRWDVGRRRLELGVRDIAIERVVLPHRRDERPRQIDTHLPVHPPVAARHIHEGAIR